MKFKERAILLKELAFQPAVGHAGSYKRLYIGDEFCERRLPTPALLAKAVDWAAANGRKLTLVTPNLSDEGMQRLSELLELLTGKEGGGSASLNNSFAGPRPFETLAKKDGSASLNNSFAGPRPFEAPGESHGAKKDGFEVVVNDWGGLSVLNTSYKGRFRLILGRLLMPKCLSMTSGRDVFRDFLDFVSARGITGLEFNTLPFSESLQSQMAEYGLASHLYLPYRFMAVTRFCACANGYALNYRDATRESKSGHARTPHCCNKGCIDHFSILTGKLLGADDKVWVKGNTWFVRHPEASFRDRSFTVDRVINNAHSIDGSLWEYPKGK